MKCIKLLSVEHRMYTWTQPEFSTKITTEKCRKVTTDLLYYMLHWVADDNLIPKLMCISISVLVWWIWHSYLHPNYLCLNVHQVTFDYSTLEAYISKTKNDTNKRISDSKSWHLVGFIRLRRGYNCRNNIHVQRDARSTVLFTPFIY